ncbi:DUF4376 domain-containing protein [Duganella aquatilis]|nr:DUF4376 domain-containing protein [Duganella aquatilis]
MKTVIVVDGIAALAANSVLLFPDHAVVDATHFDEQGAPLDGTRYLCFSDASQIVEVEVLPVPWVAGAYRVVEGALLLDAELPAWQAYLAQLASAKQQLNVRINDWRAEANGTTFPYLGKHIQCDLTSTIDLMGTANQVALLGTFPPDFPGAWKAYDNTYIPLPTVEDFKALYEAFTQRGSLNFQHAQELKAAVAAASTLDELDAIAW